MPVIMRLARMTCNKELGSLRRTSNETCGRRAGEMQRYMSEAHAFIVSMINQTDLTVGATRRVFETLGLQTKRV